MHRLIATAGLAALLIACSADEGNSPSGNGGSGGDAGAPGGSGGAGGAGGAGGTGGAGGIGGVGGVGGAGGVGGGDGGGGGQGGTGGTGGVEPIPCTGTWCQIALPRTVPSTDLVAISVHAEDDLWIVGKRGTVLRGGRSGLRTVDAGTGFDLKAVWAAGPDEAFITGPRGLIKRWDGKAWTTLLSEKSTMNAAYGMGPDQVWFAGDDGIVQRWNGHTLSTISHTCGKVSLGSVWGSSSTDVWFGSKTHALHHWDGKAMTCSPDPAPAVTAISGTSVEDVWFLTGNDVTHHTAAGDEQFALSPTFFSIFATAPGDVWGVSFFGVVTRFVAGSFQAQPRVTNEPNLTIVTGVPGGRPYVIGEAGYVGYRSDL